MTYETVVGRQPDHGLGFGTGDAKGFLDEHVLAGFEGRQGDLGVAARRCEDGDHIDVGFDHGGGVGHDLCPRPPAMISGQASWRRAEMGPGQASPRATRASRARR